jgi:hypothetical protein
MNMAELGPLSRDLSRRTATARAAARWQRWRRQGRNSPRGGLKARQFDERRYARDLRGARPRGALAGGGGLRARELTVGESRRNRLVEVIVSVFHGQRFFVVLVLVVVLPR